MYRTRIEERLKRIDRNLRLRKSKQSGRWLIECKCPQQGLPKPIKTKFLPTGGCVKTTAPRDSDVSIQYNDGYYSLFSFTQFSEEIFNIVRSMDGSGRNLALESEIKQAEAQRKAAIDKRMELSDVSREAYDFVKFNTR